MLKQIKKAKKPLSWFLIIAVTNFISLGLFFDFRIELPKLKIAYEHPTVKFGVEDAYAGSSASTTVTVRNAAPFFTSNAQENPASASTSPTNIYSNIQFTATSTDNENNSYYLVICSTNVVSPGAGGGAPTCGGTRYCYSNKASSTAQASCTLNIDIGFAGENYNWYAFVCDDHASDADCSSVNTGSGPSGSPFVVNHSPTFTSVATGVDNQNPGDQFRIDSVAVDPDGYRPMTASDTLTMYVCATSSNPVFGAGCQGTQLCSIGGGMASTTNPSCSFDDVAPTPDGTYAYTAYIFDKWGASSSPSSRASSYHVNNVTPSLGTVSLNNGNNIYLNLKGASEVVVLASTTVTDNNHCNDMTSATGTIYLSGVAGGNDCSADDNNCYQITNASCTYTGCTTGDATDASSVLTCSTTLAFHTIPTDATTLYASYSAQSWYSRLTARDDNSSSSFGAYTNLNGVEVVASPGIDVTTSTIPYGTIRGGFSSLSTNTPTTIVNYGNTVLDSGIMGESMLYNAVGPGMIGSTNQLYATSTFTYPETNNALNSSTPQVLNINITRPTTTAYDFTGIVYWGIGIPTSTISGDYYGTNTFSVSQSSDGSW